MSNVTVKYICPTTKLEERCHVNHVDRVDDLVFLKGRLYKVKKITHYPLGEYGEPEISHVSSRTMESVEINVVPVEYIG